MSFTNKHKLATLLSILTLIGSTVTSAETPIKLWNTKGTHAAVPTDKIRQMIKQHFDVNQYRQVTMQVIYNQKQQPDHVIVYLFSKKYHRVDTAVINIDSRFNEISVAKNYHLTNDDFAVQPGISVAQAQCPDSNIEFIAFAPNDINLEQRITKDVAQYANEHSFKTVRLLKDKATHDNYLNYMKCPKLKGNFYDGDADPELITTVDGVISYQEINKELESQFKYKVTNIWLACEAYNDPIKSSVIDTAQSQKYAAGINDLLVGPSDNAAGCAMKAAVNGQPMTQAFKTCYDMIDTKMDHWGFGGNGSDIFGA